MGVLYKVKAVIFAAGLGTRMRPLTFEKPKCLLEICHCPILFWQLELLRKHNINSVIITTHYLANQVVDFVNEYILMKNDMKIQVVYEPELLGSGGSLKNIQKKLELENFFVTLNGDNLTNVDFTEMIELHTRSNKIVTCGIFESNRPQECGIVTLEDEIITSFEEKPQLPKSNLANAGIYVMNREIFEYFPENKKFSLERVVFPNLIGKMKGYRMNSYIRDIGNIVDYEKAQLEWKGID